MTLPIESNVFYLYSPSVGSLAYGTKAFWGGKGDLIDNSMVAATPMTVPAASYLYMRLNYQIESAWDYAYVSVSGDNGATWFNLVGQYQTTNGGWSSLTTTSNPNGQNLGNGITGSTSGAWRYARFNTALYAGQAVLVRLRYKTDEYTNLKGVMADEIALGTFYDGAESGSGQWTLNGFTVTTGVESSMASHYYIAEFRQYRDYDSGLQTGPYNFGDAARPNWVYHYPYQDGLLITYWDAGESDDNSSGHPGEGRSLPIDAHPDPLVRTGTWPNGAALISPWSARVHSSDATFGPKPTDPLHIPFVGTFSGTRLQFQFDSPPLPAVSESNDLNSYWSAVTAASSVIVPHTGTIIRVINTNARDNFMEVHVIPAK